MSTVPSPVTSNVPPSPRVTLSPDSSSFNSVNMLRSLHMWLVAPESTIQSFLDLATSALLIIIASWDA